MNILKSIWQSEEDLDLNATLDAEVVYSVADLVVIAAPTN